LLSVFCLACLIAFTGFSDLLSKYLLRGENIATVERLTGRTELWKMAWTDIEKRPITGYGAFAGRRFIVQPRSIYFTDASDLLSSYVDAAIDIGLVGPILLVVILLSLTSSLWRALKATEFGRADRELTIEIALILSVVVVRSLVSGTLVTHFCFWYFACVGGLDYLRTKSTYSRLSSSCSSLEAHAMPVI
jgi:O-antigen ligase